MDRYDWSKLDEGWTLDTARHQLRYTDPGDSSKFAVHSLSHLAAFALTGLPPFDSFQAACLRQIEKCKVDTTAQLVDDFLRNRDQAREHQRKHEATHGWRNPPCVYEESNDEQV